MYLGYNWLITQKTLPINAFFENSKQWHFLGDIYLYNYHPRTDIYLSVLWFVISNIITVQNTLMYGFTE